MNFRRVGIGTVMFAAALVTAAPTVVQAAPITGTVNIGGSTFAITAPAVDFYGNPALGCSLAGVGSPGCFAAALPLTGSFANLVPLQVAGTIQDLQGPPITGNISLPAFMQFVNGVIFDLTQVLPGGAPDCATVNQNAPNVQCTLNITGNVVSPFVLTNSATGTNASLFFNVQVNGYTGSLGTGFSPYVGAFNTPSVGQNIAGILANIGSGIPVTAAYSANFVPTGATVPVPEPASLLLLGTGLLGAGCTALETTSIEGRTDCKPLHGAPIPLGFLMQIGRRDSMMKRAFAVLLLACAMATFGAPVSAEPIFQSGTGTIVYGVAPYGGAPIPGAPTYIGNNFNGLTDILTSPGGGYLTANPVVANNIYGSGINPLPLSFSAAGGINGSGAFGSANTLVTGPTFGGNLTDSIGGDGAVSYAIASWTSTWVESVGFNGLIGASLAAGGTFGSAASSGALSLRVRVQSDSIGNLDLGQLVLAPRANGPCFGINGIVTCNGNSFDGAALTSLACELRPRRGRDGVCHTDGNRRWDVLRDDCPDGHAPSPTSRCPNSIWPAPFVQPRLVYRSAVGAGAYVPAPPRHRAARRGRMAPEATSLESPHHAARRNRRFIGCTWCAALVGDASFVTAPANRTSPSISCRNALPRRRRQEKPKARPTAGVRGRLCPLQRPQFLISRVLLRRSTFPARSRTRCRCITLRVSGLAARYFSA